MSRSTRRLGAALLLLCMPWLMAVERPAGLGDVKEVRTWSYPAYTRVVLELNREVRLEDRDLVRLPADSAAGRPDRLYLDMPGVWVGRRYETGIPVGDGLLEAVRLGQNTRQNTRLVIDLERYDRHRMFTLDSPPRVVVDIYGERQTLRSDPSGRLPASLRRVHKIVVDPGHGGRDPGATGVGGIREKEINLAIAKRLETRLQELGFQVILTRRNDRTVDLEERTAIAESSDGDVFISIHANAARRANARGIEIYTLDANHERHSLDVASRENGVPAAKLDALQRALARLRADESASDSEQLAAFVHRDLIKAARTHDRGLPDLGLKKGPFYVLFMSSMPALLVETGFLTNKSDAKLLASARYQGMVADQIAAGIDRYRKQVELGLVAINDASPGPR